jgi:uncharacterized repeat protein (TIGR01451 family)
LSSLSCWLRALYAQIVVSVFRKFQRFGGWSMLLAGGVVAGVWGVSTAAGSSAVSVTDYVVTPADVGVGGESVLTARVRASRMTEPAYVLLTIPAHFSLSGTLPGNCAAGSYDGLKGDASRQLPAKESLVGSRLMDDLAEVDKTIFVYCTRDTLSADETWPVSFKVKGEAVGSRRSFAFAAAGNPIDGGWVSERTQEELNVVQAVDLGVTLNASANPVKSGDYLTFTLVTTNHSKDVRVPAAELKYTLPPADQFEVTSLPQGCKRSGNELTCDLGAMDAGASKTIQITGRVLISDGTVPSTAVVGLKQGETSVKEVNLDNNKKEMSVPITKVIALEATKQMSGPNGSDVLLAGQQVTMQLGAKNTGVVAANGVVVTDTVPAHFTNVQTADSRCSQGAYSAISGTPVSCTVGPLAKGQSMADAFTFTMTAQETVTELSGANIAKVDATPVNGVEMALKEAIRPYTIKPLQPLLQIGKTKKVGVDGAWRSDIPATWKDALQSTIVVRNSKDATAPVSYLDADGKPRVITVTEELKDYELYTGFKGTGWTCTDPAGATKPMTVACTYTLSEDLGIDKALPELIISSVAEGAGTQNITNTASVKQVQQGQPDAVASATVKGVPRTAKLGLGKSGLLTQPDPNDPSKDYVTYILTIKNDGPNEAMGVKVSDALQMWFQPKKDGKPTGNATGVEVDLSGAPADTACAKRATTDNVVECTLGTLPKDGTATIQITVTRPFDVNKLDNDFYVSSVDTQIPGEGTPSPSGKPEQTPVPMADVTVNQVAVPSIPMQVGASASFRTDFANIGANAAEGVELRQKVNLELMEVTKAPALSDPSAGSCVVTPGTPLSDSYVVCTLTKPLLANAALQMSMDLRPKFGDAYANLELKSACEVNASRMARTVLDRSKCADFPMDAVIKTATTESNLDNNTAAGTAKVKKESVDLSISIEDNYGGKTQDPSPLNGEVVYQLKISNQGASQATNVGFYLQGVPPSETGFTMESVKFPAGLNCTPVIPAGSWSWMCKLTDGGVLDAGATKEFLLPFKVAAANEVAQALSGFKVYELAGKVFSSETAVGEDEGGIASDTKPSNNETSQKTVVVPRADLTITKTVNPGAVAVHEAFAYTVTVTNTGPSAASKVVIMDTLDSHLDLPKGQVPSSTLNGVCSMKGQVLTCEVPLVKKDESVVVTIPVRVKLGTTLTTLKNKAQAGPTIGTDKVPSFFPEAPVESPEVSVTVKPSAITGKVVVAPPNTLLDDSVDVAGWTPVPDTDVLVTIKGTDLWGNVVEITTPKKSGGTFTFEGLPPSSTGYTVTQTQPAGYLDYKDVTPVGTVPGGFADKGATESITGVVVDAGNTVQGIVFAEVKPGVISGYTFLDADGNLFKSDKDLGTNGVEVVLSGTDYAGNVVSVLSKTTSGNGAYSFSDLPPGTYTVTVKQGANATYIGASVANALQPDATSPAITGVALESGGSKPDHNFGFKNTGAATNTLQGRVYVDLNGNGQWDEGEPGIPGVKVQLSGNVKVEAGDSKDPSICARLAAPCEVTTDADGRYVFPNLLDSDANGYTVTELPSDPLKLYADGKESESGKLDSQLPGEDKFTKVVVNANTPHGSLDFGEKPFSIAGRVEVVSGVNGADKKPMADVVLRIEGTTAAGAALCASGHYAYPVSQPCEVKTDSQGNYVFPYLPAGNYTVTEVQPQGYGNHANVVGTAGGTDSNTANGSASVIADVKLLTNATQEDQINAKNYVFQEAGNALSGSVYIDTDNNGDRSSNEPGIGGVTVTITEKTTGKSYTTTTNPDGSYSFAGLPDGTYTLTETQPSGYLDGAEKAGGTSGGPTIGTACTAANCNTIDDIKLEGGKTYEDYLFAETGATISGKVYEEILDPATGNYTQGAGLGGVEVHLVSKAADGRDWCAARADKCIAVTKADGSYAFEGVPPGSYEVVKNHNQLTEYYAKLDKFYTDGIETAGVAGGVVENRYFGTQTSYNTIGSIEVTTDKIAAHSGKLDGYLFGVRQSNGTQNRIPPIISGYVFMDHGHNRVRDPLTTEGQLGWTAILKASTGEVICEVQTNASGFYQFDNLNCPEKYRTTGLPTSADLGGATFDISFSKDGNVLPSMTASGGNVGKEGAAQITGLTLKDTDVLVEQNLPLDPEGVVYDAVTRQPVAGAVIEFTFNGAGFDPARHLVGGASFQTQTTGADGRYSFILQNDFPSGEYVVTIKNVPSAYLPGPSAMIPPCVNTLNVTLLPNGVPALMQAQRNAPGVSQTMHDPQACPITPAGFSNTGPFAASQQSTQYYLKFNITRGGSSEILNNHIPLDPVLAGGAILVTKTTPKVNVAKADLVPYTITATNMSGGALANVRVRDMLPPGFRYRKGSATWNGLPVEPEVNGRELTWPNQNFVINEKKTYQLLLMVGAGVGEGEYVNQAWAINSQVNERISNVAQAVVRVVPDPTFDCSDLIGKVFNDKNANGYQDQDEPGIPNVRVVTARGLLVTTDADGRFHVACAAIPQADRGSNFVMKLDERTLPSGFRMTTENPRDVRVTRGKMVKLNFGATVHKVLRLEVDGRAFVQGGETLSSDWNEQVEQLLVQLAQRPTVLRIAYRMTGEDQDVAAQRLNALTQHIQNGYADLAKQQKENEDDTPPLVIETESFEQNKAEGVR